MKDDMDELKELLCGRRLLFNTGRVVITRNALDKVPPLDVQNGIRRHTQGDWGDLVEEDRLSNERALVDDGQLLSVYQATTGQKFWIITEWDRSATTILLPEDY
jgi:hypothetical protein